MHSMRLSIGPDDAFVHEHEMFASGRCHLWYGALESVCQHHHSVSANFHQEQATERGGKRCISEWLPPPLSALAPNWALTNWLKILCLVKHCLDHRFQVKSPP